MGDWHSELTPYCDYDWLVLVLVLVLAGVEGCGGHPALMRRDGECEGRAALA